MSTRLMSSRSTIALVLLGLLVVACAVGAPAPLRLPLALLVVAFVPGVAVLGFVHLTSSSSTLALHLGVSLTLCILIAEVLAWSGRLTTGTALVVMSVLFVPPLALQVRSEWSDA